MTKFKFLLPNQTRDKIKESLRVPKKKKKFTVFKAQVFTEEAEDSITKRRKRSVLTVCKTSNPCKSSDGNMRHIPIHPEVLG